jgi:hypothetical protein
MQNLLVFAEDVIFSKKYDGDDNTVSNMIQSVHYWMFKYRYVFYILFQYSLISYIVCDNLYSDIDK